MSEKEEVEPREVAELRAEVRAWLGANKPGDPGFKLPQTFLEVESDRQFDFLREWQRKVYEAGWLGLDWPAEYGGRGDPHQRQRIVSQELARARAPFLVNTIGLQWAGPTILAHGSEAQKKRHLRPILSAEEIWCQGFSEPGAGSDLASLKTSARLDGDHFVLNGQKVWTTFGPWADWIFVLARTDAADSTILYLPEREPGVERWTGPNSGPGPEASRLSGIEDTRAASEAESRIARTVLAQGSAARKGALYLKRGARHASSPFAQRLVFGDGSGGGPVPIRDLQGELAPLRQIKDEDEIRRLRRAIAITGDAILEAMREARPGMYEYQVEGRIEYGFRRRGAERLGFPSIVGSGPNGTILHYDENRRQTRPGELVVMDVGAEFGYYSADVTRTIPISGRFDRRQRQLYELVLGAQRAAIDSVRPGTDLATLNRIARDHMRRHSGRLCGESGCERYFVHGLSHWLGMDVHDVGSYTRPLAPGMVFTVEPGVYIAAEGLGIRIEDDVLVTPEGAEVLSAGIPRTVEEVERAMAGR